jgi:hypothetical protein
VTGLTQQEALLLMWITFSVMAVLGVSGVLVWAVRSRQFANQTRARYLPLRSGIPEETQEFKVEGSGFPVKNEDAAQPGTAAVGAGPAAKRKPASPSGDGHVPT